MGGWLCVIVDICPIMYMYNAATLKCLHVVVFIYSVN